MVLGPDPREEVRTTRTLYEIITAAKDGDMPSHEECYYAMLAYEAMFNMDHRELLEVLTKEKPIQQPFKELKAKHSCEMYKGALNKSPKEWLGWGNDPANPAYQKRRKIAEKILDKVLSQKEGASDHDKLPY